MTTFHLQNKNGGTDLVKGKKEHLSRANGTTSRYRNAPQLAALLSISE